MGPRLFSRGEYTKGYVKIEADLLQWGRGFSAAESEGVRRQDRRGRLASMGPRLFSRGESKA